MKYTNPVIPGFYPDPSICRVGEDFYLATSSFEYFPGVPIFQSRNLVNWKQIGHCLTRESQLRLGGAEISGGIFAPTLRYHEGRFYMITTNYSNGGHFYVSSDNPTGQWSDPIWLGEGGIDPDLFWDDDGSTYFSCTGEAGHIAQRRIDIETGQSLGDTVQTWEGCGGKFPEAPHLYKINGWYYLMIAEGGTEYGHCITIARSDGVMGPWESCPHNPILTHRSTNLPIQAAGHGDLVEDQHGNWWLVCLGIRPKGYHPCHVLGRETFLSPVRWEDGWPIVGNGGQIHLEMDGPDGLSDVCRQRYSTCDDFTDDQPALHWNFLRNPVAENWSVNPEGRGGLRLRCAQAGLDSMEGQSWLGRRQQHYEFRVSAGIQFAPLGENEEAGLTVFQNVHHHYEIAVTCRNQVRSLIVRRRIGTLTAEAASVAVPDGRLTLVIEGDETEYRLGYAVNDSEVVMLGKGEVRYLSSEVGGRFTGVYLAMFATANARPSANAAVFNWFKYKVPGEIEDVLSRS